MTALRRRPRLAAKLLRVGPGRRWFLPTRSNPNHLDSVSKPSDPRVLQKCDEFTTRPIFLFRYLSYHLPLIPTTNGRRCVMTHSSTPSHLVLSLAL